MFWRVLCSLLRFSSQGLGKHNFCQILVCDWFLLMICFGCWPLVAKRTCIKSGFHSCIVLYCSSQCARQVFDKMHFKHFLTCLDFDAYRTLMRTKLWDFSCFLIRNMFGLLVVYLTHLTPHIHFPCMGHTLHIATSCTHLCYLCHALIYILFLYPSMSCLPYVLQHLVMSYVLNFILSFILHPSCIILLTHSFISCLLISLTPLSISCQKGGEYTLDQYTREFCHFYMTHVHIPREKNSISRAHLQEERYSIGEMHIPRGRRHCVNK